MARSAATNRNNRGPIKYSAFFDRDAVRNVLTAAEEKYLARVGFRIRDSAKKSIRPKGKARFGSEEEATAKARASGSALGRYFSKKARKRYQTRIKRAAAAWKRQVTKTPASPAGKPPFTHTWFLPGEIVYAYDAAARHSVVVGTSKSLWLGRLHERGGTRRQWEVVTVRRTRKPGRVLRRMTIQPAAGFTAAAQKQGLAIRQTQAAQYPARPFIQPAYGRIAPRLPRLWADSVKQTMREQTPAQSNVA